MYLVSSISHPKLCTIKTMDLPPKPSNSSAVLHYLFQQPHNNKVDASVHKLGLCWKHLFDFTLDTERLPTKSTITQYALVTRALLYIYSSRSSGKYLATPIVVDKTTTIDQDHDFVRAVQDTVHAFLSKEEMSRLHGVFRRPIGGSPQYVNMYNEHKSRQAKFGSKVFTAWTKLCNLAGDTNMAFKPSTLKKLPELIRKKFEIHGLKKGKVLTKPTSAPKRTKKRHLPEQAITKEMPKPKKILAERYPDVPPGGWMGLMTGTALCNFVTHMSPISGHDLQVQMVRVNTTQTVMLMPASVPKNFILQTTANVTLFKSNLTTIPRILVNSNETAIIAKHFVKTAVFLIYNPCNPDHHNQPTLTFGSTGVNSTLSFTLIVKIAEEHVTNKRKATFHALCNISLAIKLLKPLMTLEKVKDLRIKCEVDHTNHCLYITFETTSTKQNKIVASHRFSAELAEKPANQVPDDMDQVSLFVVDKSDMYTGKVVPSQPSKMINLKAYDQAKSNNYLTTIFSETYKIGLIKAIAKGIPCEQKINLIMTKQRMLLMSIHEYRGSIQVAQLPNAT